MLINPSLFPLGQVVVTMGAFEACKVVGQHIPTLIARHNRGDWGVLDDDDKALNDEAVADGSRVLSAYDLSDGTKIYIITEADRSSTTVLLPDEY